MLTELSNLKIGKQDPKLFEIPEGFTKFDMGGMMGGRWAARAWGAGMPSTENSGRRPQNRADRGDSAASEPEPPAEEKSDMQKAGDMLKKMFGQ